jgi:hypothetical protein
MNRMKCSFRLIASLIAIVALVFTLYGCNNGSSDSGRNYITDSGPLPNPPTVTGVTNAQGGTALTPGQDCTITGSGFGFTRSLRDNNRSKVTFTLTTGAGGANVDVVDYISWSETSISCTVPSLMAGQTYVVVVTAVNSYATEISTSSPSPGNTITVASDPTISSIAPATVNAGGIITITGTGFGATQGSGYVLFGLQIGGTKQPSASSWSDTRIICTVPDAVSPGNNVPVTVFRNGGTSSNSSPINIVGAAEPVIYDISPDSLPVGSTDPITIIGDNFGDSEGAGDVEFEIGTEAPMDVTTVTSWSDTRIVVRMPSQETTSDATVNVTIHTDRGAKSNADSEIIGNGSGKIYALFVGINAYQSPVSPLSCCVNDALGMQANLVSSSLWSGASITCLTDAQATKSAIQNAITTFASKMGAGDTFFFFFAGHGSSGNSHAYICPVDSNGNSSSDISDTELQTWVSAINSSAKKVIVFDSCNSGGFINKGGLTVRYTPLLDRVTDSMGGGFNRALETLSSMVFLSACKGDQLSTESSTLNHGYFTYYCLQGLGQGITIGPANTDSDADVTAEEVFAYASPLTIQANSEQTPQIQDNYSGNKLIIKK